HGVLSACPTVDIFAGQRVEEATPTSLLIEDGTRLKGRIVFDGRGPKATPDMELGFQKFLGLEVEFEAPHGLTVPTIMDATVPQTDGYRFVYVLPFTDRTALIEDTYYADGFELPRDALREEITRYALGKGWRIKRVLREEDGILPIVLDGDIEAYWARLRGGPAPIGLRAGLFNPITGYSLSEAVRLADKIAQSAAPTTPLLAAEIERYAKQRWASHRFYRLLNRMLFKAAAPDQRYIVLERFYGLPTDLINRFYAGDNHLGDKIRILAGKPPVPILNALKALPAKKQGHMVEEGLLG
ncbi:MAG: lycopene beta-cyclase CrtY, partial [Pseudomonadota bacterium]